MAKYVKKPITVEAIQLVYPATLTTPTGILKAKKGDYLVGAGADQFFVTQEVFNMTYDLASEPDGLAPMEVENLSATTITDTGVVFIYQTPFDADFKEVRIYRDTVLVGTVTDKGQNIQFIDNGLTAETVYAYLFTTVDNAGNESDGVANSVTTLAAPTPAV